MRNLVLTVAMMSLLAGCSGGGGEAENPFFAEWDTPFGAPPFDRIEIADFEPAILEGMRQHNDEIAVIIQDPDAPDFVNTIEAMDSAGALMRKSRYVYNAMNGTMTDDEMQAIAKRLAPLSSKHTDEILLNDDLFQRVKTVYGQRDSLELETEQRMLLKETYRSFVRGGAELDPENKEQLKAINEELSLLTVEFGEHVLKETNRFEMILDDEADLAGLPDGVIQAAAETAVERGHEGQWAFTLHKPSLIPFLQYSARRDLRETMLEGYIERGNHADELDNNAILARIASLRLQRANLLGFPTHAHYILDDNMAKEPDAVYDLLGKIWTPALARAKEEAVELQAMIDAETADQPGGSFQLEPWDWWYYAEKVKAARYQLDESMLRPYFELENVRAGLFETVHRLYGLSFTERHDIPIYHPDVKVYEVKEADGSTVAIWYSDYFPRASKRGGAWMSSFRKEAKLDGERTIPLIFNVGNFTKPTGDTPSLLSVDEVGTMFHEFGHALHGMLSDCRYQSLSGTSVARDFVELPSQVMENWAFEPAVLAFYAKHYETGEPIPAELVEKMEQSRHFNQGFATTEYLAAAFLDMDWHTLATTDEQDVAAFEEASLAKIGLIDEIVVRYRSPYFRHVFSGGYASGYYSYVWAEVLDADAFEAFKEAGDIFDAKTAKAFREQILARGGSEEPMELYVKFRGKQPGIEPLLARKGL